MRSEPTPALLVSGLSKYFGKTRALSEISFSIHRGECVFLFGPNGSGKTTTLLNIVGIERPSSGKVLICGVDPIEEPAILKKLTLLSHNLWLFADMTGLENLRFYAKLLGRDEGQNESLWLEKFGLTLVISRKVRTYSHGTKKRLALARTFMGDAEIVLLDEPFSGLDKEGENALLQVMRSLKSQGKTLLFTTHLWSVGLSVADRVIVLEKGKIERDLRGAELNQFRELLEEGS